MDKKQNFKRKSLEKMNKSDFIYNEVFLKKNKLFIEIEKNMFCFRSHLYFQ